MLPTHNGWLAGIFYFFLHLGFFGLILLGALDSSFLMLPFANDIAVIVLSSLHHGRFVLYAAGATAGSVAGCYVMYMIGRKGGENFIQHHISKQRFEAIRVRVSRRGPYLLALPALIPPPFPFTAWVLAAGALEVPRFKFLSMLTAARFVRFFVEGLIALFVGRAVVRWIQTPFFTHFVEGLVALAMAGSAWSVYRLVQTSRRAGGRKAEGAQKREEGRRKRVERG